VTKQSKQPAIYILTNPNNTTLYTGVTSNLPQRIWQHKNKTVEGFSSKYNCTKLVYFETFEDMPNAIAREKQIKAGSRKKKIELIEELNPEWRDLYEEVVGWHE
jgi:putative endonuclease